MARIRTIKPEFWTHPVMARLPADVQLLAIALLNHSDDYGYFRADPNIVRSACCPYADDSDRVNAALAHLQTAEWIEIIHHPVQGFIGRVRKFDAHQRVSHPTPSPLRVYFSHESVRKVSGDIPDTLRTFSGDIPPGKERKGKEGKGSNAPVGATPSLRISVEDLVRKWNALPSPLKRCQQVSDERMRHARSRLADDWWSSSVDAALAKIAASPFLRGENSRGWVAGIDWFLRPGSLAKIMEGTYDAPEAATSATPDDGIPFAN